MTGGVAVVIGPTGRNFAAGMSGGVAFVFDEERRFPPSAATWRWSTSSRSREPEDIELVRDLLIQHAGYTGSTVAARLSNDWEWAIEKFVKVMPLDYRRVLERTDDRPRGTARLRTRDRLEEMEVTRG